MVGETEDELGVRPRRGEACQLVVAAELVEPRSTWGRDLRARGGVADRADQSFEVGRPAGRRSGPLLQRALPGTGRAEVERVDADAGKGGRRGGVPSGVRG